MNWPWTTKKPDPLLASLNIIIDQQTQTQREVMKAVQSIADVASKQAEVLSKYLDLFKSPDDPRRWTAEPEQENREELAQAGFPLGGTEAEQADWVLNHLNEIG